MGAMRVADMSSVSFKSHYSCVVYQYGGTESEFHKKLLK